MTIRPSFQKNPIGIARVPVRAVVRHPRRDRGTQQLLRERIVHHRANLLLAHADLLSASGRF